MLMRIAGALLVVFLLAEVAMAQDWSQWVQPRGFQTPNLDAGRYALSTGVQIRGNSSTTFSSRDLIGQPYQYRSLYTSDMYSFSAAGLYALTDRLVFSGSAYLTPPQEESDGSTIADGIETTEIRRLRDLDHALSLTLLLAYKPTPTIELHCRGTYDRSRGDNGSDSGGVTEWSKGESYSLFIGFATAR